MNDYYRFLGCDYTSTIDELNNIYQTKLLHYKDLPFLTDTDKNNIKELKRAFYIFNNSEHKKKYDKYIKNRQINKKKGLNQSYIHNRIFSMHATNKQPLDNEHLRPKNVGLISDIKPDFDTPLNFEEKPITESNNNDENGFSSF